MVEGDRTTQVADATDVATLYKHLRVADVADALDGIGYFNLTLMSPGVRPLWTGMRFWGRAATMRCVPANKPMWKLDTTEDIVAAHDLWFGKMGHKSLPDDLEPGHVVVMDAGDSPEVGFWGSENVMSAVSAGAVGVVSDGYCRDTAELELQRSPICVRGRARTIIPGRIEVADIQTTVSCGGVQVRPGDIVGADDDGVLVVPHEVAHDVAIHARAILLADMRKRRDHYVALGLPTDPSVEVEEVERYYASA